MAKTTDTQYHHQSVENTPRKTKEKIRFLRIIHWNRCWLDEKNYRAWGNQTSFFSGFWCGLVTINSSHVCPCSFIHLDSAVLYVRSAATSQTLTFDPSRLVIGNYKFLCWISIMEGTAISKSQLHLAKPVHYRFWEGVVVKEIPWPLTQLKASCCQMNNWTPDFTPDPGSLIRPLTTSQVPPLWPLLFDLYKRISPSLTHYYSLPFRLFLVPWLP